MVTSGGVLFPHLPGEKLNLLWWVVEGLPGSRVPEGGWGYRCVGVLSYGHDAMARRGESSHMGRNLGFLLCQTDLSAARLQYYRLE